ncbi:MAG: histidinol dehydrogenase [Bacteroidetes bacterium]|nr:histidinol dehydrogenase [Bacteroidota bacterium]
MKKFLYPEKTKWQTLLERPSIEKPNLDAVVQEVFSAVQKDGDSAVSQYTEKFQGFSGNMEVSPEEIASSRKELSEELISSIQLAADNISRFHALQVDEGMCLETMPGVECWRKSKPIQKVGLYIPGGTAPLFSTVLMLGIPAKLAGCEEIILCSPCDKDGKLHPAILFAADLVGVTKIFKVGGIQAIAALTFGTESIPAVYKIFGPGNQYVTAAKQYAQQFRVAIDMPAGPSEVMVVADDSAYPSFVAADLLSQAEHGTDSQVVLLTDSELFADLVIDEVAMQLEELPRKELASEALENSRILLVEGSNFSELINVYAPEHLILATAINDELIEKVINAGSVFIGNFTPESAGDYASGTNHTLPTNGYARQYSGVSLDSFVKKITYQKISEEGLRNLGPAIERMAEAEELMAHKNAVSIRLKNTTR